ncbi:MAG TPA: hypothetical protein VM618_09900, partial [Acidimicrobiia bacterium]|nr:hypothetical protein [Acidimicrobiia bacterium]
APVDHLDEAAGGLGGVGLATLLWTLALLAVGGGWWWSFRHHPRWYTWVWGALPFLFVSFFFFGEVERLLPGGY